MWGISLLIASTPANIDQVIIAVNQLFCGITSAIVLNWGKHARSADPSLLHCNVLLTSITDVMDFNISHLFFQRSCIVHQSGVCWVILNQLNELLRRVVDWRAQRYLAVHFHPRNTYWLNLKIRRWWRWTLLIWIMRGETERTLLAVYIASLKIFNWDLPRAYIIIKCNCILSWWWIIIFIEAVLTQHHRWLYFLLHLYELPFRN